MPKRSEIAGGTPGALVIECGEAQPYSDEDWATVARVLPSSAPTDARKRLEREIAEFRDMPSAKELRELFQGYAEEAALIENAIRALVAAIDGSSVKMLRSLIPHLLAAREEAHTRRADFLSHSPGPKDKTFDPWSIYLNRLCALWYEWTGEAPTHWRSNGMFEKSQPKGPAIDFLVAAASPARKLRSPWNKRTMSGEMAATAIRSFKRKSAR